MSARCGTLTVGTADGGDGGGDGGQPPTDGEQRGITREQALLGGLALLGAGGAAAVFVSRNGRR